jgi:hypothetical protein
MPYLQPLAVWYAAIPLSGLFCALFAIEQLVNGWRRGFEGEARDAAATAEERYEGTAT